MGYLNVAIVCSREWKEKFELEDNDNDDTLTYHFKSTYFFRPEKSGPGLTGDEMITMPHPVILSMVLGTNVERAAILPIVNNAVNAIFHEPKDIFTTSRAMDLLFDGISIDCSSQHVAAVGACNVMDTQAKSIRRINETTLAFSLFRSVNLPYTFIYMLVASGSRTDISFLQGNNTDLGTVKVNRGSIDHRRVGQVISFNGQEELDYWPEEDEANDCNQFYGTDSTIFPPLIQRHTKLAGYDRNICRSMFVDYRRPSKYSGISTSRYGINFSHPSNTKACYCRHPPDDCPAYGTFDLYHCMHAPFVGSLPHFFDADPKLVENIAEGINPNADRHGVFIEVDPVIHVFHIPNNQLRAEFFGFCIYRSRVLCSGWLSDCNLTWKLCL